MNAFSTQRALGQGTRQNPARLRRLRHGRCILLPVALPSTQRAIWLAQSVLPHEPELRAWLSRRDMPGLDVDDIVQESYAILVRLESVEHIRDPRTYLFEVAKSVALQGLRRRRVVSFETLAEADGLQIPSDDPDPETIVAGRQELGRLARMISELPPKCAQAFVLRKIRGLSQREVAAAMGVSENTVEKHIGKALAFLTERIGRGGNNRSASSSRRDSTEGTRSGPASRKRRGD